MSTEGTKHSIFSVTEVICILATIILTGVVFAAIVAGDIRFTPIG